MGIEFSRPQTEFHMGGPGLGEVARPKESRDIGTATQVGIVVELDRQFGSLDRIVGGARAHSMIGTPVQRELYEKLCAAKEAGMSSGQAFLHLRHEAARDNTLNGQELSVAIRAEFIDHVPDLTRCRISELEASFRSLSQSGASPITSLAQPVLMHAPSEAVNDALSNLAAIPLTGEGAMRTIGLGASNLQGQMDGMSLPVGRQGRDALIETISRNALVSIKAEFFEDCRSHRVPYTQDELEAKISAKTEQLRATAWFGISMTPHSLMRWVDTNSHGTIWDHLASEAHSDVTKLLRSPTINNKSLYADYLAQRASVESYLEHLGDEFRDVKPRYSFVGAETLRDRAAGASYGNVKVEVRPPVSAPCMFHYGDSFEQTSATSGTYEFSPNRLLNGLDANQARAIIEVARELLPLDNGATKAIPRLATDQLPPPNLEYCARKYIEALVYSELPWNCVAQVGVTVREPGDVRDLVSLMQQEKVRPLLRAYINPDRIGPVTLAFLEHRLGSEKTTLLKEVSAYPSAVALEVPVTNPLAEIVKNLRARVVTYEAEIKKFPCFVTSCSYDTNSLPMVFGEDGKKHSLPEGTTSKIKSYIALRRDFDLLSGLATKHPTL